MRVAVGRAIRISLSIIVICAAVSWSGYLIRTADRSVGFLASDRLINASWFILLSLLFLAVIWRECRPARGLQSADPFVTIAYRYGWSERFAFLVMGAVSLFLGFLMVLNDDNDGFDYAVYLFVFGIVWMTRGTWNLYQKRAVALTLTPEGLNFAEFTTGTIRWQEIKTVSLRDILAAKITISLHDQFAHKEQPHWQQRGLIIRCGRFDAKPEEMLAEIEARLRAFGSPVAAGSELTIEPSLRTTS